MSRSTLLKLAAKAKTIGSVDQWIRALPWVRSSIEAALSDFDRKLDANAAEPDAALLNRLLQASRRTSYGEAYPMDYHAWPILEKELVRARPQDFITRGTWLKIPAATGGTTGMPLSLWRSLENIVAEQIFIDRLLLPYGCSMRSKVAVLRADSIKASDDLTPPYGRLSHGGQRLTFSMQHLNARTFDWYREALEEFAPQILWVYPSAAANLLALAEQARATFTLPIILASSEELSATLHRRLASYFSSRVINYYGQAERVCFAYSTEPEQFYFEPCYGRVELQSQGVETAAIHGSGFWNRAMPLVRYRTGDAILLDVGADLAGIASGHTPFRGIAGRDGEYVLTQDGMRIIGLNQIPREVAHLYQLQLEQHDYTTITIHVLAAPEFSSDDEAQILAQARMKIPADFTITVKRAERLKQTARGKTPLIVRSFSI